MPNSNSAVLKALALQQEAFGDELFIPKGSIKIQSVPSTVTVKDNPVPITPRNEQKSVLPPQPVKSATIKIDNITTIDQLYRDICNCQVCGLGKSRNSFVFGKGNSNADVMLIGEGPGAEEDLKGEPFVGRAGQLLTDILKAIKFSREEVYIANIVKCRPPGNRTPVQDEIDACLPYLEKQIALIKPKLILCLGATAALGLLKKKETLGKLRRNVFSYKDIQVMVTYHPAALLRNPAWKKDCWEDVQAFRALYDKL